MRPILKGASRKKSPSKSPNGSAGASPQAKRAAVEFASPSGRRVTFSPFAKPRRRLQPKRLQSDREENGVVMSGFAFSAADDKEAKRIARQKRNMSLLQTLYKAASKPRLSWLSLVDDHLSFLKTAQVKVSQLLRAIKDPILHEMRRRRNRRVLRSRTRHAPTIFFDKTDRQYVQSVSAPLLPPTRTVVIDYALRHGSTARDGSAIVPSHPVSPLIEPSSMAPALTPVHFGSLSELLRREGIPATEDESRENAAVREDLRGVTHRATGMKIVPHHSGLRVGLTSFTARSDLD